MTDKNSSPSVSLDRRGFLKSLSALLGTAAATNVLAGDKLARALAYHGDGAGKQTKLFNPVQKKTLFAICDAVLPKTDTPSATEVDCHGFAEHQLLHCYQKSEQQSCQSILNDIETYARAQHKSSYATLATEEQQEVLRRAEGLKGFSEQQKSQFTLLKSLIVFGYFTSEVGATVALNYLAVPGGFTGSLPHDESIKGWGSLSYY